MSERTITLRCPECGTTKPDGPRALYDPPEATVMEYACPDCAGCEGSFIRYLDESGREVEVMPAASCRKEAP